MLSVRGGGFASVSAKVLFSMQGLVLYAVPRDKTQCSCRQIKLGELFLYTLDHWSMKSFPALNKSKYKTKEARLILQPGIYNISWYFLKIFRKARPSFFRVLHFRSFFRIPYFFFVSWSWIESLAGWPAWAIPWLAWFIEINDFCNWLRWPRHSLVKLVEDRQAQPFSAEFRYW